MKYTFEKDLQDFQFWAGAEYTASKLTAEDFETIEKIPEYLFLEGNLPEETSINDFFRFETDVIAQWLGYNDWEDLVEKRESNEAREG